jgi:hypothetical protein
LHRKGRVLGIAIYWSVCGFYLIPIFLILKISFK